MKRKTEFRRPNFIPLTAEQLDLFDRADAKITAVNAPAPQRPIPDHESEFEDVEECAAA